MVFTVRGQGFGLYGYLPALIAERLKPVVLPEQYRATVSARQELNACASEIRWVNSREEADSVAHAMVIATPPSVQALLAAQAIGRPNIRALILEKPLAASPRAAASLLTAIASSGRRLRIGYTFLFTDWCRRIAWPGSSSAGARIEWTFMAHHFANNLASWKRRDEDGGGVLRFYGMHLIALLAKFGYEYVIESATGGESLAEPRHWTAKFGGRNLPPCEIIVDSCSLRETFRISEENSTRPLVDLTSPFLEGDLNPRPGDARIAALTGVVTSFDGDDLEWLRLYEAVNELWHQVERINAPSGDPRRDPYH